MRGGAPCFCRSSSRASRRCRSAGLYSRAELVKPYLRGHALNYELRYQYKHWWIDQRWYKGTPVDVLPHGFPAADSGGGS